MNNQATLVKTIDPRLNLTASKVFTTSQGASYLDERRFGPTSAVGTAINFQCNPPNRNIVVSREVIKEVEFKVVITGLSVSATPVDIFAPYAIAPAYMPISRVTKNENMVIGQATVQAQNADILHEAFCRYDDDKEYSASPNMNDTYLNFADVDGSIRSALAPYGDTFGDMNSRASFYTFVDNFGLSQQSVATIGSNNTVILRYRVEEPLKIAPFAFGKNSQNVEGFYGIDTMNYSAQFGDLNKAVSYNLDNINLSDVNVVTTIESFNLRFKNLTPQLTQPIPRNALYSYYETIVRTSGNITVPKGSRTTRQEINLQLSGIPRRVYMMCRERDTSGTKPMRYLSLVSGSLGIKINGQPSLTDQDNQTIYKMCRRNGLNLNYSQFTQYTGSVVCVDFGKGDIALHPEQAPAVSQKNEFQFFATYDNKSNDAKDGDFDGEFTVIVVYDGVFRMEDGNTSKQINPLTEQAILSAPTDLKLHEDKTPDNVYGGNLCSGLKRVSQIGELAGKAHSSVCSGSGLQNANGGRMVSRASLRNRY